ncbi:DMT family transporter [Erythrobacter litoralis]|uniref:DMT family transporter n=1 Tax=Erythrobacter litoralis TaxID=39960 RepID=UPI00243563A8|nr:DMT family transporter [Erythrobacter litoralis]MDG6078727.1 DMT family transporter [Erythrobacter litoralis]
MRENEGSGILLALCGFALLSTGDAVIKTMAGEWSPLAVAALRFTFGAIGLSALLATTQGPAAFKPSNPWLQLARGFCLSMATIGFFSAVFIMPLAEATALVFVAPILTALLSGPLLKEKVRPATFIASAIAFVGVLIVLRPNFLALGIAAFLPLGSALFMSLLVIANRASANQGSALSMQVFMAVCAAPIITIAALIGNATGVESLQIGWPTPSVALRCAVVAITASTAHYLVYLATTKANAATIAPMTYVQLLVAGTLGWWWFGDTPDLMTLIGALVIIGAGLYLWRDNRRKLQSARAPS